MTARTATVTRSTKETSISLELNIDGSGKTDISTGVDFFDHMLTSFAVHGAFDLTVHATGDINIEAHHTVEDTAIVLGQAFNQALGDKAGIARFGDAFVPMDESLVHAVVDLSGRPYHVFTGEPEHLLRTTIGGGTAGVPYFTVINQHVFESFATHAKINLHVRVISGRDPHHITEAEYKAVARALRAAVKYDGSHGIPSTKGAL